jgi:hypothetical protein
LDDEEEIQCQRKKYSSGGRYCKAQQKREEISGVYVKGIEETACSRSTEEV